MDKRSHLHTGFVEWLLLQLLSGKVDHLRGLRRRFERVVERWHSTDCEVDSATCSAIVAFYVEHLVAQSSELEQNARCLGELLSEIEHYQKATSLGNDSSDPPELAAWTSRHDGGEWYLQIDRDANKELSQIEKLLSDLKVKGSPYPADFLDDAIVEVQRVRSFFDAKPENDGGIT